VKFGLIGHAELSDEGFHISERNILNADPALVSVASQVNRIVIPVLIEVETNFICHSPHNRHVAT